MSSTNIQIAVKVRPLIERELKDKVDPLWLIKENSIIHIDSTQKFVGEPYSFDHIFDQSTNNKQVYDVVVKPLVMSCLEGINSTIFAYGQTSSGKTHTMLGDKDVPGIIMYTVQDIFKHIDETTTKNFLLRCSYLEIYNEKINDLLDTNAKDLKIREDYDQMVYVQAKEEVIRESNELFLIMKKGMKTRKIGCTDMNERSSRSHTIFKLVIQSQNKDSEGSYTESSLSLVDLAGSERVGQMNMKGERQAEGVCINKSLTTLGLVIRKLSENEQFINYRDSKLTRLLQHSLGGNSRTLIICAITVAAAEETKSTLEFAQRAKYVKNRPIINEKVTDKDQLKQYAHLCQDYKCQIEKLRLEKLERENTINALEDKISNIRLFTSDNFEKPVKVSNILQRRHTLGYYTSVRTKSLAPLLDIEGSDESSDESDRQDSPLKPDVIFSGSHDSPLKQDIIFTVVNEEDKENFDTDVYDNSPSKSVGVPKTLQTPSPVLRMQKRLLEKSYDRLKKFTSHEKELTEEQEELQVLVDSLRLENIDLRQQNDREKQLNSKILEINKEIFDQLIILQSTLKGKPVDEIRRQSLHTITEEDFEMVSDEVDPISITVILNQLSDERNKNREVNEKYVILGEENLILKQQLEDRETVISSLNASCTQKNDEIEAKYTALTTENEQLKRELKIKDTKIEEFKKCISEYNDIKNIELEILTKKINQLNDYKEEMHKQVSELQKLTKERPNDETENTALQKELNILGQECDKLKQQAEYNNLKIGELEGENQKLKTELLTKADLEKQVKDLSENNKLQDQAEKEITDLRQVVNDLESQLNDLRYNYVREEEKKVLEINETLILRENRIAELEKCQASSNEKWDKYIHEFSAMKEKYDAIEEVQVDMEKKIERLTQVEIEYTSIINNIKNVLGHDSNVIDFVNTVEALKTNDTLKLKVESSGQLAEELNCYIDLLKKEIQEFADKNSNINVEENSDLKQQNENLLKIQDLENKNVELTKEVTEIVAAKEHLQALLDQNLCEHKKEIQSLTENSVSLRDQLQENLNLKNKNDENSLKIQDLENKNIQLTKELAEIVAAKEHIQALLDQNLCEDKKEIQSVTENSVSLRDQLQENLNLKNKNDENSLKIQDLENKNIQLTKELAEIVAAKENLQILIDQTLCEHKKEIQSLTENSTFLHNQLQEKLLELGALRKQNDALNGQIKEYNKQISQLKSELEDIEFQLTGEQKEVENMSQQLDEKSSVILVLKEQISLLNKKEGIKTEEKPESLGQGFSKTTNELQQLNKNSKELNKLVRHSNLKTIHKSSEQEDLELKTTRDESVSQNNRSSNERQQELEQEIANVIKDDSELKEKVEENEQLEKSDEVDDDHSSFIEGLRTEISHLQENFTVSRLDTAQLQEVTNINGTLRAALSMKEEEIKELKEKIKLLKEKSAEAEKKMLQNVLKVSDEEKELKKLDSFDSQKLELKTQVEKLPDDYTHSGECLLEVEQKIANLTKKNCELIENNSDLKQRVTKYAEEINTLKEKCSIHVQELKIAQKQLGNKMEELVKQTESYNSVVTKCSAQDTQIENLKEELDNKTAELDDKSQLYNNILTNYANKNVEIELLEIENDNLKNKLDQLCQKQIEISDLYKSLTTRNNENERLKKENLELKTHLDSKADLQKNFDLNITSLKKRRDFLENKFNTLTIELEKRTVELDEATTKNKCLATENTELTSQLQFLLQKQLSVEKEIEGLEARNLYLKQQVKELSKDNIELNLQLTKITAALNREQQETIDLKNTLVHKSKEINTTKAAGLKDLLDMKRHLDKLSEELSHLKGKYNSLEVQLHDCQDLLKSKIQELDQQKKKIQLQTDQLTSASEEILTYKLNLEKTQTDMTLLRNTISKLTDENHLLEEKLSKTEDKAVSFKQMFYTDNQRLTDYNELQELRACKKRADDLESHLKLEKSKVESLTKQVQLRETEIEKLQGQINDLVEYKKKIKEKISDGTLKEMPLPRLSDEGRPLSPNELRRIKRQSIHDKRRGLVSEISNSLELPDTDCSDCMELRSELGKIEKQNKKLRMDIEELKKNNVFLDTENEDMLKIIKEMEENESKLYTELETLKKLPDASSDGGLRLLQIKFNEVITKKTELEEELLQNKKLISKYKNRILDMENKNFETECKLEKVEKELRRRLDDDPSKIPKTLPKTEDKETQATCDLHDKYKMAKKLCQIRRQEGNYLRAKLNLPPDCAVLPEDVQRQPTNV